jgi:hypothetical protein
LYPSPADRSEPEPAEVPLGSTRKATDVDLDGSFTFGDHAFAEGQGVGGVDEEGVLEVYGGTKTRLGGAGFRAAEKRSAR